MNEMNILVLNCGSSSVKFQIIRTDLRRIEQNTDQCLAKGEIQRIGTDAEVETQVGKNVPKRQTVAVRDTNAAVDYILRWITSSESQLQDFNSAEDIHAVGHRVVHGGEKFKASVLITDEVIQGIEDCAELAPLHNPENLKGIHAAKKMLGSDVPQVAVFDTSFHTTMPETSYLYAIPYEHYHKHKIRRYGFHGTSHRYVAHRYRQLSGKTREETNVISLHLGNGCSACAIRRGESIDTSMGLTPLEGLVMGTRSGDLDPSILVFLSHKEGLPLTEVDRLLNNQSGLLGLSGITNDMRELLDKEKNRDHRASLAIDVFCNRVRKYIGAYLAELGRTDALIFTGGIGENSPVIRERICKGLEWIGIAIDPQINAATSAGKEGMVHKKDSRAQVYVIPTNEELLIARDTVHCIQKTSSGL
jgi:acetate kinase